MAGMAGDPAGTAASGLLLQAFYTVPEQYQQSLGDRCAHRRVLRRCRLLETRSHDDHWTKCRHPETAHDAVSSYDCTFDDLELVYQA
jgi:hypothetical protein